MNKRQGIFQNKQKLWWGIDYNDANGDRHREKVGPTPDGAWQKYIDVVSKIQRGELTGVKEDGLTFETFVRTKYMTTVPLNRKWSTAEVTRAWTSLEATLIPYFGKKVLTKISREDIEEWMALRAAQSFQGRPLSPATINKDLMRLRQCLRQAVDWEYLRRDPTAKIKMLKVSQDRVRYLEPEQKEEARLLSEAKPDLHAYILWAIHTGARRSELCKLDEADVDFTQRLICFRHTKNGTDRYIPLTMPLLRWLAERPVSTGDQHTTRLLPALTPNAITVAFHRLTQRLGIKNLRFHDLRHHTASMLTMHGANQRTVMQILGHKDPRMTIRYQHLNMPHVRRAMETLELPPPALQLRHSPGTAPV